MRFLQRCKGELELLFFQSRRAALCGAKASTSYYFFCRVGHLRYIPDSFYIHWPRCNRFTAISRFVWFALTRVHATLNTWSRILESTYVLPEHPVGTKLLPYISRVLRCCTRFMWFGLGIKFWSLGQSHQVDTSIKCASMHSHAKPNLLRGAKRLLCKLCGEQTAWWNPPVQLSTCLNPLLCTSVA